MAGVPPPPPQAGPSRRPNSDYYWNRLPSIQILVPPKGINSYAVDERCFTYCTQTVRGRAQQSEPWCRTVCLRKVFDHEVRKIVSMYDPQTNTFKEQTVEAKYPLPPEGQHLPAILTGKLRPSGLDKEGEDGEATWRSIANDVKQTHEEQHWKEGWYVWMTRSKWATQEKMDAMMNDLDKQAEWQRVKMEVNADWERAKKAEAAGVGLDGHSQSLGAGAPVLGPPLTDTKGQGETLPPAGPIFFSDETLPSLPTQPFPDVSHDSILLSIPPPLPPIDEYIKNALAPASKVLKLTRDSLTSGQQVKFVGRLWEKAGTDQPFVLARNVFQRAWKVWVSEDDEDGRKSNP